MSNDINKLREVMFDLLAGIKDGSIDKDKAKAMNDTAQVLVNTAKVEVDYIKATEANQGTGFIQAERQRPALTGERVASIRGNDPWQPKKIG